MSLSKSLDTVLDYNSFHSAWQVVVVAKVLYGMAVVVE